jgi:hypothetical protein
MKRSIEITINEDGTVEMEGLGFEGKGCHEALEAFRQKLGKTVKQRRKAEFYKAKVSTKEHIKE